jgi:mevalonate kinase
MVRVPAKLIISGEHSVLHNRNALTCVINKHLAVDITFENNFSFYNNSPFVIHIIESFFDYFKIQKVINLRIDICSEIQQNCGLGSSAALIIGVLSELCMIFCVKFDHDGFLNLAQCIENFQHGNSSGVDLKAIWNGGVCLFEGDEVRQVKTNLLKRVLLIDTGKSKFATKDVVNFVSQTSDLGKNSQFLTQFTELGYIFYQSLIDNNTQLLKDCTYNNHLLLKKLGIVSEKVSLMIEELKKINVYAKVCGAGTIGHVDDCCGYVAIFHEVSNDNINELLKIVENYGFNISVVDFCENGNLDKIC